MTGEQFCLYLPCLAGDCVEVFVKELSEEYADDLLVLLSDNAPAHLKVSIMVPSNIVLMHFPGYSSELNLVERWFLEFRWALLDELFNAVE